VCPSGARAWTRIAQPKHHVCAGPGPSRQPKIHVCAGMCPTLRQEPKSILGPAQPMTQDYFGFCRKRGPRIVGFWRAQAPYVRCGCAKPPSRRPKCQVCVGVCTTLRQDPSITWAQWVCPAPNSSPNATCPHAVFLR